MRRTLSVALLVALAGCTWDGDAFYGASDAETAIAPGDYRLEPADGHPTHSTMLRVSVLPNGLTRIEEVQSRRGKLQIGFAPLDSGGRSYILWLASTDGQAPPAGETPYGLAERRADGHIFIALPDCDRDRAVAVAAGAVPSSGQMLAECRFPSRASLEAGLRAFANDPGERAELVPVR